MENEISTPNDQNEQQENTEQTEQTEQKEQTEQTEQIEQPEQPEQTEQQQTVEQVEQVQEVEQLEQQEFLFKIVLIGNTNVGKTNIISQYCEQKFVEDQKNTIGVDFKVKKNVLDNNEITVQFWDTAGQEKFRAMSTAIYKNANGIIIVYDITNPKSFEDLDMWKRDVQEICPEDTQIIILGNKKDLKDDRRITEEQGKEYGEQNNFYFMEVSAKDNSENDLDKAIEKLYKLILETQKDSQNQHKASLYLRREPEKLIPDKYKQNDRQEVVVDIKKLAEPSEGGNQEEKKCCGFV